MSQGTSPETGEGETQLVDAVVAPIESLAIVRDGEEGDVTVLSLTDHDCMPLVLSGTAVVIWDQFDRSRTVGQIAHDLATEYGLDESMISEQVQSFVQQLLGARLLERCGADRAA